MLKFTFKNFSTEMQPLALVHNFCYDVIILRQKKTLTLLMLLMLRYKKSNFQLLPVFELNFKLLDHRYHLLCFE